MGYLESKLAEIKQQKLNGSYWNNCFTCLLCKETWQLEDYDNVNGNLPDCVCRFSVYTAKEALSDICNIIPDDEMELMFQEYMKQGNITYKDALQKLADN